MFEVVVYMFNSNFTLQQKFVTVPLRVIPLSRNLRAHARTSYTRKYTRELPYNASILFTRER